MENKEFWLEVKEILNCSTPEQAKEFVDVVLERIEIFGTPFVCNKCISEHIKL